jgi:uncharacterized membrane protein YhaH (DUF805 family)
MNFDLNKALRHFRTVLTEHYTDFQGRVSRRDFWIYIAVYVALLVIVAIVQSLLRIELLALLHLALFLPTAGMIARRLQDTGRPGSLVWLMMGPLLFSIGVGFLTGSFVLAVLLVPLFMLLGLIVFFAAIYLVLLCIQRGTPGPNAYGPEPVVAL